MEGIKFAFHEENMIRTAIRALTLNVYHGKPLFCVPHILFFLRFSNILTGVLILLHEF